MKRDTWKSKKINDAMKRVKAPAGYHWMKSGKSYKLMKHTGKFVKHTGASLYASFPIQKVHKSSSKKN